MQNETSHVEVKGIVRRDGVVICELACGKVSATVMVTTNYVQVIFQNASHRAWKGMGKYFPSMTTARAAYKKPEMAAIFDEVDRLNA